MTKLFSPISIGDMTVKNRFVRSATQDFYGNPDGTLSGREIKMYKVLAQNDVGLIISAHAYVEHPRGRANLNQNGIYQDRFITGYSKAADAVHEHGGKFVVQVSHAGLQTNSKIIEDKEPLDLNNASDDEILQLVDDYAMAVYRTKLAGCDGSQIHMAHGYLLSCFLSSQTNRRSDRWGGGVENRVRIILEILKRSKALAGEDYPILAKLNSEGGADGTASVTVEDVVYIARVLEENGVCAIEVSGGAAAVKKGTLARTGILRPNQEAYFKDKAKRIKDEVNIPVILVGGIRSRQVMDQLLNEKIADMISMCRPFIKEHDLAQRIAAGQDKSTCISCNMCRNLNGINCVHD